MGRKQKSRIGLFDISKKEDKILFTWYQNNSSSILEVDTNGNNVREIIPSSADTIFFNPKYNADGTKIAFIGKVNDSSRVCAIYIANSDGTNKKKITFNDNKISDLFFSKCEQKIYFINSANYGHYSPLGQDELHNSDIYWISTINGEVKRLTNQSAYNMYNISEFNCDSILLTMSYPSLFGLTILYKNKPDQLIKITPKNKPREPELYDSPTFSKSTNLLFFVAPYELYSMDINKRVANLVIRDDDMVENFRLLDIRKRIIHTNSSSDAFFITDFKGSNERRIKINFD